MVLIPPALVVDLPSKLTSLDFLMINGFNIALPFPPVTPIDTTLSISNPWGSTSIFVIVPLTTGCNNAVIPRPGAISTWGRLITS